VPNKKLKAIIRLFRPDLSLAAGICVIGGQIIASGRIPPLEIAILGFICAFGLSGSALVFNDYFDYEVDCINAPDRPLPSGAVSRSEALILAVVITLLGISAAGVLGVDCLFVGIIFWVIGFLYNWRFKQTGLPGNLMVAASVAVTFILGAMTMQSIWNPNVWIFSLIAFFIDLGEEIAGDALDMEGDKKRGSRSIALLKGKQYALRISVALWGVVILLGLIPFLFGFLGKSYLGTILIMDAVIIFFSIRLLKSRDARTGLQSMRGIYMGATIAIIAFIVGQIAG
jgi:geranylgeranylglycerol-phosphate geranylgeranyltransferase